MIIQRNQMPLEIPTGHSGRAWTIKLDRGYKGVQITRLSLTHIHE